MNKYSKELAKITVTCMCMVEVEVYLQKIENLLKESAEKDESITVLSLSEYLYNLTEAYKEKYDFYRAEEDAWLQECYESRED